jgi:predicted nucleic acid-binding protein
MALREEVKMERVFIDTGAWYAYINAKDPDHFAVREFLESFSGRIVTSTYVFDEIVTLTQARLGYQLQERPDKDYTFTDCTSFVLMRRLKLSKTLSLDEHFAQEGFEMLP